MKIEPGRSGLPNLALDHWSMNTFLLIEFSVLFVRVRSPHSLKVLSAVAPFCAGSRRLL